MVPIWLIGMNYYASFIVGFIGNATVILLLKFVTPEIQAYSWIMIFQAVIEIIVGMLAILLKIVSLLHIY